MSATNQLSFQPTPKKQKFKISISNVQKAHKKQKQNEVQLTKSQKIQKILQIDGNLNPKQIKSQFNKPDFCLQLFIHKNLKKQHSLSDDFFFAKDINDLLLKIQSSRSLLIQQEIEFSERKEYLKFNYKQQESELKQKLLITYYKYHINVGRFFFQPLGTMLYEGQEIKRKLQYSKLDKQFNTSKYQEKLQQEVGGLKNNESIKLLNTQDFSHTFINQSNQKSIIQEDHTIQELNKQFNNLKLMEESNDATLQLSKLNEKINESLSSSTINFQQFIKSLEIQQTMLSPKQATKEQNCRFVQLQGKMKTEKISEINNFIKSRYSTVSMIKQQNPFVLPQNSLNANRISRQYTFLSKNNNQTIKNQQFHAAKLNHHSNECLQNSLQKSWNYIKKSNKSAREILIQKQQKDEINKSYTKQKERNQSLNMYQNFKKCTQNLSNSQLPRKFIDQKVQAYKRLNYKNNYAIHNNFQKVNIPNQQQKKSEKLRSHSTQNLQNSNTEKKNQGTFWHLKTLKNDKISSIIENVLINHPTLENSQQIRIVNTRQPYNLGNYKLSGNQAHNLIKTQRKSQSNFKSQEKEHNKMLNSIPVKFSKPYQIKQTIIFK